LGAKKGLKRASAIARSEHMQHQQQKKIEREKKSRNWIKPILWLDFSLTLVELVIHFLCTIFSLSLTHSHGVLLKPSIIAWLVAESEKKLRLCAAMLHA
jgi:hypothetical protein